MNLSLSLRMNSVWVLNPKVRHTHLVPSIQQEQRKIIFRPHFLTLLSLTPRIPLFPLHNHSEQGEIEVENEKDEPPCIGTDESQEAWKQALDTFREQALKIQGVSQEAYQLYSKKAIVILMDTTQQLKIQAKEISEQGKEYLTTAAQNSPEVKEIVETFTSPDDDLSEISEVRDFYVGIPYGFILFLGGFLSFMVSGSIAAIRFGLILGGVLLAMSISSLRSYKRGEPSPLTLKGQAAIASILFLREIGLLAKGSPLVTYFTALISGAVVAFYVYRIILERTQQNSSNLETDCRKLVNPYNLQVGITKSLVNRGGLVFLFWRVSSLGPIIFCGGPISVVGPVSNGTVNKNF